MTEPAVDIAQHQDRSKSRFRPVIAHRAPMRPVPTDPFAFHDAIRAVEEEVYGGAGDRR